MPIKKTTMGLLIPAVLWTVVAAALWSERLFLGEFTRGKMITGFFTVVSAAFWVLWLRTKRTG